MEEYLLRYKFVIGKYLIINFYLFVVLGIDVIKDMETVMILIWVGYYIRYIC